MNRPGLVNVLIDKITFSAGRDGLKLLRRKRVAVAAVWD
jgi:hypothetical protein